MTLGTRQAVRCRGSFHQEGSVARPPGGIKRKRGADEMTTPDFELAPDAVPGIAQVIVDIWTDKPTSTRSWIVSLPDRRKGWPR